MSNNVCISGCFKPRPEFIAYAKRRKEKNKPQEIDLNATLEIKIENIQTVHQTIKLNPNQ